MTPESRESLDQDRTERNLMSLAAELGLLSISDKINNSLEGHPFPAAKNQPPQQDKPFSLLT